MRQASSMKHLGILLVVVYIFFIWGPPPVHFIGAVGGLLFFEGLKREIILQIKSDKDVALDKNSK